MEYDQYGDPTEYTGTAYTDGEFLVLDDVFLWDVEDVEIPIGDADTLLDDTGEIYWIKGEPDFEEKLSLSNIAGNRYYKGDYTSEYRIVLTLYEDGTYTIGDMEEGTYIFEEKEYSTLDVNTNETRNEFYVHESALENEELFKLYRITDGNSYWGEDFTLEFLRGNTMYRNYFYGNQDPMRRTWELSGNMITIIWDDGETDEATLNPDDPASLTLSSTGETFAKLF